MHALQSEDARLPVLSPQMYKLVALPMIAAGLTRSGAYRQGADESLYGYRQWSGAGCHAVRSVDSLRHHRANEDLVGLDQIM
ncbi:hypothetical protein PR202_ga16089 [Eleusine coracana subsp. coracana]|uniref:Uncharacterized protein n=1 Tax=Eleusine coracana subsp. coracana TaxID=191504 RepID=A0AAV5CLN2_ELECO|nr:hypothetical protein PR202_ga16089 [Eleusine coracana subsp. coracana]